MTGDVSYNGRISITGETHLILADGATMTFNLGGQPVTLKANSEQTYTVEP